MKLKAMFLPLLGCISTLGSFFKVNPSLGVAEGNLTAPTGTDANIKALVAATPVRDTLPGIVRTAFAASEALKIGVIVNGARKAFILPAGTTITSALGDATLVATLTPDDPNKATSAFEGANADSQAGVLIDPLLEPSTPKFSWESLVGKVCDKAEDLKALGTITNDVIIVQDQTAATIKVYRIDPADNADAVTAFVALAEDAQFVLEEVAETPRQPGE